MNKRRKLLTAIGLCALAVPVCSFAQQQGKIWRVGFLANGSRPASLETSSLGGFPRAMRELGYVEGKNLVIDWRFAEGKQALFNSLATELVQLNVDVMVAATSTGIAAAQRATTTIPIVMVATSDPVRNGFIASFPRPGGNITGLSNNSSDVSVKYLELLRVAIPRLSSVAVWTNSDTANRRFVFQQIQTSAKAAGIKVLPVEAQTESQVEAAFGMIMRERPGAMIVTPDAFFSTQARRIAELAAKHRLPTMFWTREHVEAGGLMSYGQNNAEHYQRAATYVDKILKGAKPGNLPVEQPMKLELVINLKTAKTLGLAIPQELLLRADKVIE